MALELIAPETVLRILCYHHKHHSKHTVCDIYNGSHEHVCWLLLFLC